MNSEAEKIKIAMQKAAPSVFKVRVLGQSIHVLYRAQCDQPRIHQMLSAMGCQVRDGQTAPDGTLISGEQGRIVYGRL